MVGPLGVDFLISLGVGALGGLLSGVGVYFVRQKRRTDRLRRAIATEITSTPVDSFKTALIGVEALETPIIDTNLDKIYLLNQREIAMVARYQNQMAKIRDYNERNGEDDRVNIPKKLADDGSRVASNTANLLVSNIWVRPRPIGRLKELFEDEDDEPVMTEEEREQKEKELLERAGNRKESGELRRKKLEGMDVQDVIDDYLE